MKTIAMDSFKRSYTARLVKLGMTLGKYFSALIPNEHRHTPGNAVLPGVCFLFPSF